ncbi:MAG: hypothetical protein HYX78_01725 [Armatimonadetes bacterium]|nr:hypothetical protein [Armatimonadota bacterium]
MYHVLGRSFDHVSVVPDINSLGRVRTLASDSDPDKLGEDEYNRPDESVDEDIMVCQAGGIADRLLGVDPAAGYPSYDEVILPEEGDDLHRAFGLAQEHYGPTFQSRYDELHNRTEEILKSHWASVEALAIALMERRYIAHDDAVRIISGASP